MARTVTFSAVKESVRTRYGLPAAYSTTTYVTTAMVEAWVNESIRALYGLINAAWGDDYFTTQTALTTTAGLGTSPYPTRFLRLRSLAWHRGTDDIVLVSRAPVDEFDVSLWTPRAWTSDSPSYRLTQDGIRWFPIPSQVYNLTISYVQSPTALVAPADTFEAGEDWEEWIVCDVCAKIAASEQSPEENGWLARRGDTLNRILHSSPVRDEWEPEQVRDLDLGVRSIGDYEYRALVLQRRR